MMLENKLRLIFAEKSVLCIKLYSIDFAVIIVGVGAVTGEIEARFARDSIEDIVERIRQFS